jgi:hypothetical protein
MPKPIIRLAYRQYIGDDATAPFDQKIFNATWSEFLDRSTHLISLTYHTGDLSLLEVLGDQLLLTQIEPQTLLLKLQPGLSIVNYTPSAQG